MQGLNGSSILAAAFDPVRNFRAYAWTDTGDILSLVIPHSTRASVCKASVAEYGDGWEGKGKGRGVQKTGEYSVACRSTLNKGFSVCKGKCGLVWCCWVRFEIELERLSNHTLFHDIHPSGCKWAVMPHPSPLHYWGVRGHQSIFQTTISKCLSKCLFKSCAATGVQTAASGERRPLHRTIIGGARPPCHCLNQLLNTLSTSPAFLSPGVQTAAWSGSEAT